MAKLEERHIAYLNDPLFLKEYLEIFNNRLIYSNNRLELKQHEMDNLYDYANISTLKDNYEAFKILRRKLNTKEERPLTQELIKEVANTINMHATYISNDYRTLGDDVKFKGIYPIELSENINNKMQNLLDNYYGEWSKLDIFEREALFNIEFLRIHPFEDGNGRTSRLLLNYNLLRQGHAPVLIPAKSREDYFNARNTENVKEIKKLFEKESANEIIALDKLIEIYENTKRKVNSNHHIKR